MSNITKTIPEQASEKNTQKGSAGTKIATNWEPHLNYHPILLVVLIFSLSLFMSIRYPNSFPHADNFAAVLLDTAQGGILVWHAYPCNRRRL